MDNLKDTMGNVRLAKACVTEFVNTFEPPSDPEFWLKLMEEEAAEFKEAAEHVLKEYADFLYVLIGYTQACEKHFRTDATFPRYWDVRNSAMKTCAVLDTMFSTKDTSDVLASVIRKVHASNMSKVGDDGKPLRHPETGKILKGPNYKPPHLDIHELYKEIDNV